MSGKREMPDQRPVEWPAGIGRPKTIQEMIQETIRVQMSREAAAGGMETFEEADDFDVDDEEDMSSPYEMREMPEDAIMLSRANGGPKGDDDGEEQREQGHGRGNQRVRAGESGLRSDREGVEDESGGDEPERRESRDRRYSGAAERRGSQSAPPGGQDREPPPGRSTSGMRSTSHPPKSGVKRRA